MWRTEWHDVIRGPVTLGCVVVVGGSVVAVVAVVAVVVVAALEGVSEVATPEVPTPGDVDVALRAGVPRRREAGWLQGCVTSRTAATATTAASTVPTTQPRLMRR
jgi:hypothetical protein